MLIKCGKCGAFTLKCGSLRCIFITRITSHSAEDMFFLIKRSRHWLGCNHQRTLSFKKGGKRKRATISDCSFLVAGVGLEPTTFGLWARRATNCSTPRWGSDLAMCQVINPDAEAGTKGSPSFSISNYNLSFYINIDIHKISMRYTVCKGFNKMCQRRKGVSISQIFRKTHLRQYPTYSLCMQKHSRQG